MSVRTACGQSVERTTSKYHNLLRHSPSPTGDMKPTSLSRLLGWSISICVLCHYCPPEGVACAAVEEPTIQSVNWSSSAPVHYYPKRTRNQKRRLLWDYTNTQQNPHAMDRINFHGPIKAVSNWNAWTPPELRRRLPFQPTVHEEAQLSGLEWNLIQKTDQPIIHFFSEPDRHGISPRRAAFLWKKHMVPLRKTRRKKLVSPSCASDAAGTAWISEFMALVADAPPDFLGLNFYGSVSRSAIDYLTAMHRRFPRYPVVVSEIASTARGKREVVRFTAELANWMDATDWIFEYGFFGCMPQIADGFVSPDAQLMNPGGSFTDLMYKLMYDQPIRGWL